MKQRLQDQFIQSWQSDVYVNNICITYRLFKSNFCFENYLIKLSPKLRRNFLKFRLSSHKLPIQQLRYADVTREQRLCNLCPMQEIGDEFHYLFNCSCPLLKDERKRCLSGYFNHHPNVLKLNQLMNTNSKRKLNNLCRFIGFILSLFN